LAASRSFALPKFPFVEEELMSNIGVPLRKLQKKADFPRFVWLFAALLILTVSTLLARGTLNSSKWGVLLEQVGQAVHAATMDTTPLFLVQTVNTAAFSPPSPDPSGITYLPTTGLLWVSDGEVDEIPALFANANLFGVTLAGVLAETKNTVSFSSEPTDLAYNPNNGHIFYSDDNTKRIYEVNPGGDGIHGTGDDSVTSFSTTAFGSTDPEGLSYDAASGDLFISDDANSEVYRVDAGANGIFDGVPASGGDDVVSNFDTTTFNLLNPQGIDFDAASGNLVLVGRDPTLIYEVTTSGSLVRTFDIKVADATSLAGVVMALGSKNPVVTNYYVVDRGVDNNFDPNENDGKLYEFTLDPNAPTVTPVPTSTLPPPTSTPTATPIPVSTATPDGINDIFLPKIHRGS
jgi:hypothetical protein